MTQEYFLLVDTTLRTLGTSFTLIVTLYNLFGTCRNVADQFGSDNIVINNSLVILTYQLYLYVGSIFSLTYHHNL
jgi:hypothetical protein